MRGPARTQRSTRPPPQPSSSYTGPASLTGGAFMVAAADLRLCVGSPGSCSRLDPSRVRRRSGAFARTRDLRRSRVSRELHALRVRESRRAQGREAQAGRCREHLRFVQSVIIKAIRGGDRTALRHAAGGRRRRAFSEYGLLAKTVQTPADRSWVAFELRPEARWHDGKPITADDVCGASRRCSRRARRPIASITRASRKVEKTGERSVKFSFKPAPIASCR